MVHKRVTVFCIGQIPIRAHNLKQIKEKAWKTATAKKSGMLSSPERRVIQKVNLCTKCSRCTQALCPALLCTLEKPQDKDSVGKARDAGISCPCTPLSQGRIEPPPARQSFVLCKGGLDMRSAHNCTEEASEKHLLDVLLLIARAV